MTVSELDTFYFKFKNLLLAGKNATLTLKSEAGRSHVNLDVDLGHLLARAVPQQPHQVRNGPARMRRRERRAEARLNAGAAEATKSAEEVAKCTEIIEKINEDEQHSIAEEATDEVIEKVTDELCSDREYGDPSKVDNNVTFEIECFDPGNKCVIQDVYNHMGESLEQMFRVFKVNAEDQHYQLEETFQLRPEMKNFKKHKEVIVNFKRQGCVPGGGCVKFFRKFL